MPNSDKNFFSLCGKFISRSIRLRNSKKAKPLAKIWRILVTSYKDSTSKPRLGTKSKNLSKHSNCCCLLEENPAAFLQNTGVRILLTRMGMDFVLHQELLEETRIRILSKWWLSISWKRSTTSTRSGHVSSICMKLSWSREEFLDMWQYHTGKESPHIFHNVSMGNNLKKNITDALTNTNIKIHDRGDSNLVQFACGSTSAQIVENIVAVCKYFPEGFKTLTTGDQDTFESRYSHSHFASKSKQCATSSC